MSDGPLESWFRDAVEQAPHDLWNRAVVHDDDGVRYTGAILRWTEYHTDAGRIDLLLAVPGFCLI